MYQLFLNILKTSANLSISRQTTPPLTGLQMMVMMVASLLSRICTQNLEHPVPPPLLRYLLRYLLRSWTLLSPLLMAMQTMILSLRRKEMMALPRPEDVDVAEVPTEVR